MLRHSRFKPRAIGFAVAFMCLLSAAFDCAAQSGDANYPAPVFSNEISGRIAPRDLGDARRTHHFYTFRGTEGDLLVTLDSSELIGDVDVFIATGLRPLIKFTLFGDAAHVTKGFYLRKEETLILRVEARAAGDAEGSYRITFGGSFAPAPTELANAPQPTAPTVSSTESRGRNVRRVTSTGARIEEPAPAEVAKEPEAKPSPTPAAETAERKTSPAPRRSRGSRPTSNRSRGNTSRPQPATTDAARADTPETKPDADTGRAAEDKPETVRPAAAPAKKPPAPRRRGARAAGASARNKNARTEESASSAQPSPGSQPASGAEASPAPAQRLVVVTKDGETLERDMNTVRRVTVENNQLVIVTKDGKVIRQPMANVLRMSIEP